jgi:ribosomal protein L32
MGQPKKQTSSKKRGMRRSHHTLKLARSVNSTSPVRVYTTKKENPKSK